MYCMITVRMPPLPLTTSESLQSLIFQKLKYWQLKKNHYWQRTNIVLL